MANTSFAQNSIAIEDTRDVISTPSDYNFKFRPQFKTLHSLGVPAGGSGYYTVLGFRGWGDNSGGKAHELAFGDENDVFVRSGWTEGWQDWRRVIVENPNSQGATIRIGNGNAGYNLDVPVGASPGGYNIDFLTWRDVVPNQVGARIRAERINNYQPGRAYVQGVDLVFQTSNGITQENLAERMRIRNDGTVGIGTSDTKGYMLAVGGAVIAESVKVQLKGSWPDYVFTPEHKLPALQEVENYIQKNRHLPEIPAAEEINKQGIELGEMNAKLLKKIEELTLYVIELRKEVDALKNK
ncbi:hypothetical protein DDR33_24160 [Pararcticibacter amylolyticus]|uniref:Uncharacterized protein n=2 Tax=Pararcticibacter amylolyticus TaxID=2173175 RepID=A0A2U2PAB4_9SPHI|nr:hypothetical protein DDR33_24160 [Pararcticibacter amylolyticus]